MWIGVKKENGGSHDLLTWALGELLGVWLGSNWTRNFFLTKLERILTSLKFIKVILISLENTWRKTWTYMALYSTNPKQFRNMSLSRDWGSTSKLNSHLKSLTVAFVIRPLVFSFVPQCYSILHFSCVRNHILIRKFLFIN